MPPQAVDRGDFEKQPNRLDHVQAREVIGAGDGLSRAPAETSEAAGLGRLVLGIWAVPQAIQFAPDRSRPAATTVRQLSGARGRNHRPAQLVRPDWHDPAIVCRPR
jgi:hypothetical protein